MSIFLYSTFWFVTASSKRAFSAVAPISVMPLVISDHALRREPRFPFVRCKRRLHKNSPMLTPPRREESDGLFQVHATLAPPDAPWPDADVLRRRRCEPSFRPRRRP